jgi:hypothetical protein
VRGQGGGSPIKAKSRETLAVRSPTSYYFPADKRLDYNDNNNNNNNNNKNNNNDNNNNVVRLW